MPNKNPNLQPNKTMPQEQQPEIRNQNYEEVCLGFTEEQAMSEAARCLGCKKRPCVNGCPVSVRIPEFLAEMSVGNFEAAYEIIRSTNTLPAVSGRVCPQERQCESKCTRALKGESVSIGKLERFCADYHMKSAKANAKASIPENADRVAIVGSGPAGLACANDLAKMGYKVDVFEALHKAGGVLVYGIPEFRLPKKIVQAEIDNLISMGVSIHTDMVIGKILSVDELFDSGYKAVFIASGAGLPRFLGIPGENSNGVYSANEFLTRINLMKAYNSESYTPVKRVKNIAVVGGGNVAMDAARCAKRLGSENVYIIYRRGENEMPARIEEIEHAKEEGIIFKTLSNPIKVNSDSQGTICSVSCVQMELGEPDASGRRSPVEVKDSEFTIDVEMLIVAVGTSPNPLIRMTTPGLDTDKRGCIITSDGVSSSRQGVFAGGDAVTGDSTVILAMGAGRNAAKAIDKYIKDQK